MKKIIALMIALMLTFSIALATDSPHLQPQIDPELIPIIEDICATYVLIINYIDINGNPIAPQYIDILNVSDSYNVTSPEIEGYLSSITNVTGTMLKRDVQHSVIYYPNNQMFYTIDDLEVPLGLGYSVLNLGVCIE